MTSLTNIKITMKEIELFTKHLLEKCNYNDFPPVIAVDFGCFYIGEKFFGFCFFTDDSYMWNISGNIIKWILDEY